MDVPFLKLWLYWHVRNSSRLPSLSVCVLLVSIFCVCVISCKAICCLKSFPLDQVPSTNVGRLEVAIWTFLANGRYVGPSLLI